LINPEEEKYIKETGIQRLRERYPTCSYGHVKSKVEHWMVDIGKSPALNKSGNISIVCCPYDWENDIEWAKP